MAEGSATSMKFWKRHLTLGRCTAICAYLWSLSLSSVSIASTAGGEADSASLRTLIQAREMYALAHRSGARAPGPGVGLKQKELIDHLQRLSDRNPTSASIRRLALIQHSLGDDRWRTNISRLTAVASGGSPFETERELS